MNHKIKLGLYVILMVGAITFGALFYSAYKKANQPPEPKNIPHARSNASISISAKESTNLLPSTNPVVQTNVSASESVTNTNETTEASVTNHDMPEPVIQTSSSVMTAGKVGEGHGSMLGYLGAFVLVAILLGLLLARDLSEYFAGRGVEFLFNDKGTGLKNPEYEEAEQAWANGQHLDAIRMMREYLTKYPREQYVALRIAEIYEKDLKNDLAAALEYEEVLKNKLPPQRWGWAAIHLCNLYSKLHKTDEAIALLRRIVTEYGETPAAEKARTRLAMFETVGEEALDGELPEGIELQPKSSKPIKVELKPGPASNLPPGFRPKDK